MHQATRSDRLGGLIGLVQHPLVPAAIMLGLVVIAGQVEFSRLINRDVGWYLVGAAKLLDGAKLYGPDFSDINPPLIVYLTIPPIAVARWLQFSDIVLFRIYVFLLAAGCLSLSARALGLLFPDRRFVRRFLLAGLAFCYLVLPGAEFGQREHLLTMFLMPYLLLAVVRAQGLVPPRWLALVAGLLGAAALCLKPHFLIVILALEPVLAVRTRSLAVWLRSETITLGAVGPLYLGFVWYCEPSYLTAIVPLARDTYWAYADPVGWLVGPVQLLFLAAGTLAAIGLRRTAPSGDLALVLLIAAYGSYGAYLLQHNAWPYHRLPADVFLTLLPGLAVILWLDRAPGAPARWARFAAPLAFGTTLLLLGIPQLRDRVTVVDRWAIALEQERVNALLPIVRAHAPDGSIFFLSSSISPAFPLVNEAHVGWSSRFPCLWLLPAVIRMRAAEGSDVPTDLIRRLDWIERYQTDVMIEDLRRTPPSLIIVDRQRFKQGFGNLRFDFLAYFEADPRFRLFWKGYTLLTTLDEYQVYRRL